MGLRLATPVLVSFEFGEVDFLRLAFAFLAVAEVQKKKKTIQKRHAQQEFSSGKHVYGTRSKTVSTVGSVKKSG